MQLTRRQAMLTLTAITVARPAWGEAADMERAIRAFTGSGEARSRAVARRRSRTGASRTFCMMRILCISMGSSRPSESLILMLISNTQRVNKSADFVKEGRHAGSRPGSGFGLRHFCR